MIEGVAILGVIAFLIFISKSTSQKAEDVSLLDRLSEDARKTRETEEEYTKALVEKHKDLTIDDIVFSDEDEVDYGDKVQLLVELHGFEDDEASELIDTANREKKNAKLKKHKRQISQKAQELYSDIPVDDKRIELSDEVKSFIWTRDGGKCVRCGSREKLEFDHIIPFSKGGSNTARNIELLCEKCNREKSAKI